jgi:hypothetical protein
MAPEKARHMHHEIRPDENRRIVTPGHSAAKPISLSDGAASRQPAGGAARTPDFQYPLVRPETKKAAAPSVPGTEYWLP